MLAFDSEKCSKTILPLISRLINEGLLVVDHVEFYVWLLKAGRHSQYHFLKSFKISTLSL